MDEDLTDCSSLLTAVQYVDSFPPAAVIVAAPFGSAEACQQLRIFADDCIYLASPEPFSAAGTWYSDCREVSDIEIRRSCV